MATLLNADKTLNVYIVGHTDNVGTLESNMKLSEDRANSVVSMLINTYKVSAKQVTAKGVGPLAPLAGNQTEEGRKLNRRVELVKR